MAARRERWGAALDLRGRITVDCEAGATCVMAPDGSDRTVLVTGHTGAIPSPDLSRVAYADGRGVHTARVVAALDDGRARPTALPVPSSPREAGSGRGRWA